MSGKGFKLEASQSPAGRLAWSTPPSQYWTAGQKLWRSLNGRAPPHPASRLPLHFALLHQIVSYDMASHRLRWHRMASHRPRWHRMASHNMAWHRIVGLASYRMDGNEERRGRRTVRGRGLSCSVVCDRRLRQKTGIEGKSRRRGKSISSIERDGRADDAEIVDRT